MSKIITTFSAKDRLLLAPLPLKTDSYSPLPHEIVINTIQEELDKANIKIVEDFYLTAKDGKEVEGHFRLNGGDSEMNIKLIFHNSYNKSMPLRIALGGNVIVCRNGMVMGDMGAFKRKHTGNILEEFKESIHFHIENAGKTFDEMKRQRERMKEIEITKRTTAELLGRLFIEDAVVTSTQLAVIKREIENPSFNYGVEGSVWNLYNAVTVGLKDGHPRESLKQHIDLHKFIKNEFKLA